MVRVNGNMVPPYGEVQGQGSGTIRYTDSEGKPGTINQGDSLRANDKDAKKKKNGDKKRNSKNRSISIERDPKDKDGHVCSATIYMHVHLKAGAGCKQADVQAAKDKMEEAAKKWNGTCKCKAPPPGKQFKVNKGCTIKFKLIWHDESDSDVIDISVVCNYKPGDGMPGEATPGSGKGAGIRVVAPGKGADPSEGYYAHELGHNLFGTGNDAPNPDQKDKDKKWDEFGHNPDKGGLMRDTAKHGGIGKDDAPSDEEFCILAAKYDLCDSKKCCQYEDIPAQVKDDDEDEMLVAQPALAIVRGVD